MILTAVLIPPALLLLIIAMDHLEDRLFAVPESPRPARRRRRPRLLPRRRPGPDEIEQPLPEAA
ncbi:hypothetical protein E3E14_22465 [Streptomyces sp. ICN441]|uniref:Uncharacterized protein n=1 Tax=Streptomyces tirandamycinicus TaxID=2174846 RepID=A0A2S1T166_9ACTN|nr:MULTISPECIES: hypothetical protein [Streptomyces]AWI32413.1 hypothetical protein DDW44_29140 [Streptomyces tirandamycinicus]MCY0984633.1 hypothetical protein [Streptomyces tirandamycinicus]NNJ07163.1 hypothetical protein [Streptomyces sp. PKU-MA01144]TFE43364.1 hypothetical protein E3E14_22465 [Streptomyces sp. ICN441]